MFCLFDYRRGFLSPLGLRPRFFLYSFWIYSTKCSSHKVENHYLSLKFRQEIYYRLSTLFCWKAVQTNVITKSKGEAQESRNCTFSRTTRHTLYNYVSSINILRLVNSKTFFKYFQRTSWMDTAQNKAEWMAQLPRMVAWRVKNR